MSEKIEVKEVDILIPAVKVISGFRITIPEDIRELYGIELGDKVEVRITKIYKMPKKENKKKKRK